MQDEDREDIAAWRAADAERRARTEREARRLTEGVWRAQLADMDRTVILAFLRERGAEFMARLAGRDELPAVYPRMADDED
jgi:RecB family exonuclease